MASFKLFGVEIDVSINGDKAISNDIELCLRLKPPCVISDSIPCVINPTPLQSCRPKRKRGEKARPVKRRTAEDGEPEPVIPRELVQKIRAREGATEPVFLYQKKLENSDVGRTQNRLFVLRREGFERLMTEEERITLYDPTTKGLQGIASVDARGGTSSPKLGLNMWPSLNTLVINSGWYELVKRNGARQGDWVQIWGYREMEKLCLAINFIMPEQIL